MIRRFIPVLYTVLEKGVSVLRRKGFCAIVIDNCTSFVSLHTIVQSCTMVYSSRDTGNYPVSSLLRTSVSYDPANTTPAADSEMTSHSLTMVDETIVHDWQISSVGVGCTAGNQEALLAAYHQPSCTPERPLSAGSASTSWSAASGIESATDEFTVNQHHHHQQQQEKQVSSSVCCFFLVCLLRSLRLLRDQ